MIINNAIKFAETTVTFHPNQLINPVVKRADKPAEVKGITTHLNCLKISDKINTNIKKTATPKVNKSC